MTGSQRVLMNSSSNGQPVTGGVPWGLLLGPALFNIFLSEPEEVITCTLAEFADGGKLRGKVDISEQRDTL